MNFVLALGVTIASIGGVEYLHGIDANPYSYWIVGIVTAGVLGLLARNF